MRLPPAIAFGLARSLVWAFRLKPPARRSRRNFNAAKTTRLTDGGWLAVDGDINELIGRAAPIVTARVRSLVRNFPAFTAAVDRICDLVVGPGLGFQSQVRGAGGSIAGGHRRAIEDAWKFWMDEADFAGEQHFHEIERLAMRTELEAGEYLIVKRYPKNPSRYLPFALQVLEPAQLTCSGARPKGKNKIDRGVEYDPDTGRRVAYWIDDSGDYGVGRTIRMPAEQVFLNFNPAQPGQRRGISPFAPSVILAKDFDDFLSAELTGAKMASKWLALVKKINPEFAGILNSVANTEADAEVAERIEELQEGVIEYLQPGEDVELKSHQRPTDGLTRAAKLILNQIAACMGLSYAMISGDYQDLNYNTLRGQHNDMRMALEPKHARRIRQLNVPVFRDVLDWAALKGRLTLPGYFQNPWPFRACTWHPPVLPSVDPLKESKASRDDLAALVTSPQRVMAARGADWQEVLAELEEFKNECERRGLVQDLGSTALDQNPASLGVEQS